MLYCHEPEPPAGELMVIIPSFHEPEPPAGELMVIIPSSVPLHVGWVLLTDAERITG
jgi:hypothetical protein